MKRKMKISLFPHLIVMFDKDKRLTFKNLQLFVSKTNLYTKFFFNVYMNPTTMERYYADLRHQKYKHNC